SPARSAETWALPKSTSTHRVTQWYTRSISRPPDLSHSDAFDPDAPTWRGEAAPRSALLSTRLPGTAPRNLVNRRTYPFARPICYRRGQAQGVPLKEKLPLNVGGDASSTMSVPTRSQSGSRSALRIHICRSPVNNGGPGADSHRKLPARPCNSTWGTKK